jgi:iron complex transport system substrate-binding protein
VAAADPEVVVIAPCGYDVKRAAAEARRVARLEEWAWLGGRRVWAVDSNALLSRPGPRLTDGVETLARIFNPTLFSELDPMHGVEIGP